MDNQSEAMMPNPYAPPVALGNFEFDQFEDGLVWRDGDLLVIRSGAALPKKCFVTGQATNVSVVVRQHWQPNWVYLLILPGLLPYFIVSPMLSRYVELKVPVAREIMTTHLQGIKVGFVLILVGMLMAISAAMVGRVSSLAAVLVPVGIVVGLVGFFVSSRQPVTLDIERLEGDLLTLRGVHRDCLADLPSVPATTPSE